eukprot:6048404-Pyramimonas_sp.AAC.1
MGTEKITPSHTSGYAWTSKTDAPGRPRRRPRATGHRSHPQTYGNYASDDGSFAQAKDYIRAEFHSDDGPDGFTPGAYACLRPLI